MAYEYNIMRTNRLDNYELSMNNGGKIERLVGKLGDILYPNRQIRRPEPSAILDSPRNVTQLNTLNEQLDFLSSNSSFDEAEESGNICLSLAKCIEAELRDAKTEHLGCGEVLVPCDLTTRVAVDVLKLSEDEPCGLRGCLLYINFEDKPGGNVRRIGKVKYDPESIATFELCLTLKQDITGWLRLKLLPLKNCWKKPFAKPATVVVGPNYILAKNKLYRSDQAAE